MRPRALCVVLCVALAGCSGRHHPPTKTNTTTTATLAPPTSTSASTTTPTATTTASRVSTVTAADLGASWRPGCPVDVDQLRRVTVDYWGFDDQAHMGALVVHASVVSAVVEVFDSLRAERFPIRRTEPIDAFSGSDEASMNADNTSAFNCRYAVADGPPRWSMHAYGKAIDVNPVENPYLQGGKVQPPGGAAFVDRSPYRPGMAVRGGVLVNAFAAAGWSWGGRWSATPDYQHFDTG